MPEHIDHIVSSILSGKRIDKKTALLLAEHPDRQQVWNGADRIRKRFHGSRFSLCSIINAKSGRCTEDCRFCAQSARHKSGVDEYETVDLHITEKIAADCSRHGVHRLSLVTSGRGPDQALLDKLESHYTAIAQQANLKLCGSMGILTPDTAGRLRQMGIIRYHCNLEASRNFFPEVCTTHTWEDKIQTLKTARKAGMSLCSGGIIGMGESMPDRIDLAFELRDLDVDSIPLNIFTPIPGTPLADLPVLDIDEVMTTIALFRFINPTASIRIAGGRQQLKENQYRCFMAGANGAMVGNYLTTDGTPMEEDLRVLKNMGFSVA